MKKLLHTQNLSIGYQENKSRKILQKGMNLELCEGEIISLIGQNGVGKTTFIKTISGLLPSQGGEIYFSDVLLEKLNRNALAKKFSVVLTDKPSSTNITVEEIISLGRHPYSSWLGILTKQDKIAIEEAINQTRINYLVDKKLYQLSDGQLQKVMIARALAQQTDLIFLDEPTAHLDLYNKIEIMLLLKQISRSGKGILISTHDLQLSIQLADKFWLLNFNEDVKEGIPEDLILNGDVEKSLYLSDFNYDFRTGHLKQSTHKRTVSVNGKDEYAYWTKIALEKKGFKIESKANIVINIKEGSWQIGNKKTVHHSIESLLQELA